MNINILVENASSVISNITTTSAAAANTTDDDNVSARATTTHDDQTTTTRVNYDDNGLPAMAVHFLTVAALFAVVLVLAGVNAYLHFKSRSRRRRFLAAPPPVERTYR